jgi:peptidyl-tRNA hydrolase, PTH1 family
MHLQLVVGLHNPGPEYKHTRHNAGAWFLQTLLEQENLTLTHEKKFQGASAVLPHQTPPCYLFLPNCFMNLSGNSIQLIMQYYKIAPQSLLVAHDDLDLPVGTAKLKTGGGHGGHNGLRSIIQHVGTNEFHRLRIGIGHPGHRDQVHDYVLSPPSRADRINIDDAIQQSLTVLPFALHGEWSKAMQMLHTSDKG